MKNIYKIIYSVIFGVALIAVPIFAFAQETPSEEPVVEPEIALEGEEVSDVVEDLPDESADPSIDAGEPEVMEVLPELISEPESEQAEITTLSEAQIPAMSVHVEQINWNTFRFRPSSQLGAKAYTYSWDFGDSKKSDQRIVDHSFSRPGTFHVSLKVDGSDLQTQDAVIQVHVGFFYLANWRLWVLLLLLAAIIIVASAVTGMTSGKNKPAPRQVKIKPTKKESLEENEVKVLDSLSDETGDLDSIATTGLDTDDLSDELALLESLDNTTEDISTEEVSDEEPDIGELLEGVSEEVEAKTAVAAVTPEKPDPIVDFRVDEEKLDKGLDELLTDDEEKVEVPKKAPKKAVKKKTKAKKTSRKRKTKKK